MVQHLQVVLAVCCLLGCAQAMKDSVKEFRWQALPMQTGFTGAPATLGYQLPEFRAIQDRIFLRGTVFTSDGNSIPQDADIAILPKGFRPPLRCAFSQPAVQDNSVHRSALPPPCHLYHPRLSAAGRDPSIDSSPRSRACIQGGRCKQW